jgi:hypothetical protein
MQSTNLIFVTLGKMLTVVALHKILNRQLHRLVAHGIIVVVARRQQQQVPLVAHPVNHKRMMFLSQHQHALLDQRNLLVVQDAHQMVAVL